MTAILLTWLTLTLIYVMVLGSFQPWNLLAGGLLSAGLLAAFRSYVFQERPGARPGWLQRMLAFIPFLLAIFGQILSGSWKVSLQAVGLRPLGTPGMVVIPMEERSRQGVLIFCLAISLSPTSVLVQINWQNREMLFHVMDASDPEQVRRTFHRFYQRYQRRVFP